MSLFKFFFFPCRSFEDVCSRLQNTLESLRALVFAYDLPTKDALIQLVFGAVISVRNHGGWSCFSFPVNGYVKILTNIKLRL